MKPNTLLLLAIGISIGLISCDNKTPDRVSPKVVYGKDNRKDLYQIPNTAHFQLAHATAALVSASNLTEGRSGVTKIKSNVYGDDYQLCTDEPFYTQPTAAFCSGFLIDEDIMVTAGHCIRSQNNCKDTNLVFGFSVFKDQEFPNEVPSDDVYHCSQLIHSEVNGLGADFAVIKLDRPVKGRTPLTIRSAGQIQEGEPLVVIGHPAGLPTKIADGATVREVKEKFFVSNLDTYGGNSGSAVFNNNTLEVEGILVRGESDFVYTGQCYRSNFCKEDECRGEDVTKISEIYSHLPNSKINPISFNN